MSRTTARSAGRTRSAVEPAVHPLAGPVSIAARPELTDGVRVGVLLSHGFTGQPVSVRAWAEALGERGHGVEAPRLPGHGTSWQDANTTTWADWHGELERAFERLAAAHDVVVVGGLSMGGALALRLAADHPDRVAGVVVVNPALATRRLDVKLLPVLKHLVPSFPGIGDDIAKPGVTEHGYTRTPLRAAASMMAAWPRLVGDLPRITAPLLYLRSRVDHVVDGATEPLVLAGVSSREVTRVELPDSLHVATLDHDAPLVVSETLRFLERVREGAADAGAPPAPA